MFTRAAAAAVFYCEKKKEKHWIGQEDFVDARLWNLTRSPFQSLGVGGKKNPEKAGRDVRRKRGFFLQRAALR